ncbi:tripartite motif-containing 13-like, partial [Saccostrea cucullata]|uniref:tripartite motif-containing 13-like n=1 Tax=Saccostrea cuccullata TaxID=36930 RepID=UPI002ED46818
MAASKPQYPLGSPQEHIEMCKTHDLPIDVICEECDEFICGKCAKTVHKDHEWNTLPTASTQRRRDLLEFLTKIKEGDLPGINKKLEKVSKQITENKEVCDSEIKKLQKHVDEIMARLNEIRKKNEQRLRDNLEEKNKKLNIVKSELNKKKKEIEEMVKFMEDNNSALSDYGLIVNHRDLTKMLSVQDFDIKDCKLSVRYSKGEISDKVMENMIGKIRDVNNISLTETSSVEYGDPEIVVLRAWCEGQCYTKQLGSDNIEQVNK